ncbi:MAG: hypothetical protein ACR2NR_19905 [Solirubrobacteraceae bacterium]
MIESVLSRLDGREGVDVFEITTAEEVAELIDRDQPGAPPNRHAAGADAGAGSCSRRQRRTR